MLIMAERSFALIDYTEDENFTPPPKRSRRTKTVKSARRAVSKRVTRRKRNTARGSMLDFNMGVDVAKMTTERGTDKVTKFQWDGRFQTPFNIFVDASYWYAGSDSYYLAPTTTSQQSGNATVKLGFNWFRLGSANDLTAVDFYGGLGIRGEKKSDFAHSRNDKIFGVQTSKKFHSLMLGLEFDMRLTGKPKHSRDMPVGNIRKLTAVLGWRVSPDIHFMLEGATYKIDGHESEDDTRLMNSCLNNDITAGYLSPEVHLGFSPMIGVRMGGTFRTKRVPREKDLYDARLWDLKGVYGNSIFAYLNISI